MRRLLSLLTVLALLATAVVVAACGEDEGSFDISAAEAAEASRAADAAKFDLTAKVSGAGLPTAMTLKASGTTATTAPRMDMTMDLGSILAMAGAKGDGKTRLLLDGSAVYVDPPAIQGADLPGGATWVTADLGKVMKAMGIDSSGFAELMRITPDQQLAAMKATASVKEVGKEKIDGVQTVHLRGTVKPSDYLKALPADRRAAAEKALEELDKLPGGDEVSFDQATPVDMWIGEDKLLRRLVQKVDVPAQQGVPGGKVAMTMNFHDYGTKLDIERPAKGDVFDATSAIVQGLKSLPAATGGTTTG